LLAPGGVIAECQVGILQLNEDGRIPHRVTGSPVNGQHTRVSGDSSRDLLGMVSENVTSSKVVGDQPIVLGDEVRSRRLNHLVVCFFPESSSQVHAFANWGAPN